MVIYFGEGKLVSIKGKQKELYIGKTECNIITFWGNKITIEYEDLKRIDYRYCAQGQSGYVKFIDLSGKITQFEYKDKLNNEKIKRTIGLIHENFPNLKIRQKEVSSSEILLQKKKYLIVIFLLVILAGIGIVFKYYITHSNGGNNIVSIPIQDYNVTENSESIESAIETEVFTTTLTAGHYIVGIDIPIGTYSFFSKKGSGNLISNDGSINEIFDSESQASSDIGIENFGTEELNNIPLCEGTILTVTSTQEISAGCEDGLVSGLKPRNQELDEIELGYGLYTAGDDFDPGTYNVTWIEGNGNIQTNPYDSDMGINEIMGQEIATYDDLQELNDKLYIRSFNNLIMNEGDILEINDIKVKLTPSN